MGEVVIKLYEKLIVAICLFFLIPILTVGEASRQYTTIGSYANAT